MYKFYTRLFILLFNFLLIGFSSSCPNDCICKWKSGKEWVECASRGLKTLPRGSREETQVLDLSNNNLISIVDNSFLMLKLINLQRLYLSGSNIKHLSNKTFIGLQGLVELDLSENNLKNVPNGTFAAINNLMKLNLAGNPLKVLYRDTFIYLSHLIFLDLNRCQLLHLESGSLSGLNSLEFLRLNDNLLTSIPAATLPLTVTLHGISLHGNPWLCNCNLNTLFEWLIKTRNQIYLEVEPNCTQPIRLQSRLVRTLKLSELACVPEITLHQKVTAYEGENVTLQCEVQAKPQAAIIWLLNGKTINPNQSSMFEKNRLTSIKQSTDGKIIALLQIHSVKNPDGGTYECRAKNEAGLSSRNVTLKILQQKFDTIEISTQNLVSSYAAIIALGALIGTLFALSCFFLSIYLYAYNYRLKSKNTYKNSSISVLTSDISNSALKQNSKILFSKSSTNFNNTKNLMKNNYEIEHVKKHSFSSNSYSKVIIEPDNSFSNKKKVSEIVEPFEPQFSQPDLINKAHLESKNDFNDYKSFECIMHPYSNYLDQDGYPLNFGLPKLNPPGYSKKTYFYNNEKSLVHDALSCRSILFKNKSRYPLYPHFENHSVLMEFSQFVTIPHSINQNQNKTTSNLFLIKEVPNELPETIKNRTNSNYRKSVLPLSPMRQIFPQSLEVLQQPESPDEGYVGDVMDV